MQSMLQTMQSLQEMNQTIASMKELFPDMDMPFGPDTQGEGSSSMLDMLMYMLTPEQKAMYEAFLQPQN